MKYDTVNIDLLDGGEILGKLITPAQNMDGFFTFFENKKQVVVTAIPHSRIKSINFYEGDEGDEEE